MKIRQAGLADLDKLVQLRLRNAQYHSRLSSAYQLKDHALDELTTNSKSLLENDQARIYLAVHESTLAGYIIGLMKSEHPLFNFPKRGYIDDAFINEAFQRTGIGHKLFNELIQWFRSNHAQEIDLSVISQNEKGINFWRKLGFKDKRYNLSLRL